MTGLVCYAVRGEKNGVRAMLGARFCAVRVRRGTSPLARLSAVCAAVYLRRRGVRRAVFPKDYPHTALFARCGVAPEDDLALRMVCAPALTRAVMARLRLMPESARVALVSDVPSHALSRAAGELSRTVRRLALCAPDGERLARALRWDCGASVSVVPPGGEIAASLAVSFAGAVPRGPGAVLCLAPKLRLVSARGTRMLAVRYAHVLPPQAEAWEHGQLLAALYAAGALRAEEITVERVVFLPKEAQNANFP